MLWRGMSMKLKECFLKCSVFSLSIHSASLLHAAHSEGFMQDLGGGVATVEVNTPKHVNKPAQAFLVQQPKLPIARTMSRHREVKTKDQVYASTVEISFSEWQKACRIALKEVLFPDHRLSPSAHQGEFLSLMNAFGIHLETKANWNLLWNQLSHLEKLNKRNVLKRNMTRTLFKEIESFMKTLLSEEGSFSDKKKRLVEFVNQAVTSRRLTIEQRIGQEKRSSNFPRDRRKPGREMQDHIHTELKAYNAYHESLEKSSLDEIVTIPTVCKKTEEVTLAKDALWPDLYGQDALSTLELNAKRSQTPTPIWDHEISGFVSLKR